MVPQKGGLPSSSLCVYSWGDTKIWFRRSPPRPRRPGRLRRFRVPGSGATREAKPPNSWASTGVSGGGGSHRSRVSLSTGRLTQLLRPNQRRVSLSFRGRRSWGGGTFKGHCVRRLDSYTERFPLFPIREVAIPPEFIFSTLCLFSLPPPFSLSLSLLRPTPLPFPIFGQFL